MIVTRLHHVQRFAPVAVGLLRYCQWRWQLWSSSLSSDISWKRPPKHKLWQIVWQTFSLLIRFKRHSLIFRFRFTFFYWFSITLLCACVVCYFFLFLVFVSVLLFPCVIFSVLFICIRIYFTVAVWSIADHIKLFYFILYVFLFGTCLLVWFFVFFEF